MAKSHSQVIENVDMKQGSFHLGYMGELKEWLYIDFLGFYQ